MIFLIFAIVTATSCLAAYFYGKSVGEHRFFVKLSKIYGHGDAKLGAERLDREVRECLKAVINASSLPITRR